jgi:hypothetical protein
MLRARVALASGEGSDGGLEFSGPNTEIEMTAQLEMKPFGGKEQAR